jgi:hypothetical protein
MESVTEFYLGDTHLVAIKGIMAPLVGQKISIRGVTYEVAFVSYAVDYSDEPHRRGRCNVTLVKS